VDPQRKKHQDGFATARLSFGSLMPSERDLLQLLHAISPSRDDHHSLEELSARAGWSPFHLHRAFRRMVGETQKRYTLRLRLERAAVRLVSSRESILDVALASGFASHEVFTRAFRRHFGQTPTRYRVAALGDASPETRRTHHALVVSTGPCIGLFHLPVNRPPAGGRLRSSLMPTLSIERKDLTEQPVLLVRLRTARHELSAAIGAGLGKTFPYAQKTARAIVDRPFTRYLSTGPGLFTIEVGLPIGAAAAGEGEIEAGTLPGGPVAAAVHGGAYDQLSETYAAIERWIEANGFRIHATQAPWESYVTDPADHPDPADWRTHVYWPLAE
jgi:AraC family transcriptional regulator